MGLGAGAEHAAVVGNVQLLVPVGRPAVRALGSLDQVREPRARRGPQPERAIDVQPGAGRLGRVGDLGGTGRRSRCSPRLPSRRRSPAVVAVERLAQGVRAHPALIVCGDLVIEAVPRPTNRSARGKVECAFSPANTRICGAPVRPFSSTSQPTSSSTWFRAAASAVAWAICVPVTNANDCARGSRSRSTSQLPATSSATAAAAPATYRPAFWSQVEVSQSAASDAGTEPPITNPKYRGPGIATAASLPTAASSFTTSCGSLGPSGSRAAHAAAQRLQVDLWHDGPLGERLEEVGGVVSCLVEQLAHERDATGRAAR